ncbi:RNA polymerase sigma factor [Candidatus Poribacteria bacterium]|nr:RNA polymerase sigma factor [Candidatus Poribacteria bacterium]MYH81606.1 RNA polymerase sigma factor [Candidatus Poribacteria bacterium]MYK94699.1 RNA polymerase sigma factor [Candidatus Poribacteria bacterium]
MSLISKKRRIVMHSEELIDASDAELVVIALAGNTQAFDVLVNRYRRAMLTVAQQIVRNAADAEDVVQDAFLRAFEALPQLTDLNRFGAWLHSITRNRALRYYKNASRYQPQEDMEPYLNTVSDTSATDPAQIVESELTQQGIRDAIQSLPADYQAVIELYYWAEMPQQRMAEFLSLPLTTVKWRLRKAKELLKTILEKRGYGEDV